MDGLAKCGSVVKSHVIGGFVTSKSFCLRQIRLALPEKAKFPYFQDISGTGRQANSNQPKVSFIERFEVTGSISRGESATGAS